MLYVDAQFSAAFCSVMQCSTVMCCEVLCFTVWYILGPSHTMLYSARQCFTVFCSVVYLFQYCTVLCVIVQCCLELYAVVQ